MVQTLSLVKRFGLIIIGRLTIVFLEAIIHLFNLINMNDQLPDRTVLLIILTTLLLVFLLAFSFKSKKIEQEKSIQWMDSSINYDFVSPI